MTIRAGAKAGHSDPVVLNGRFEAGIPESFNVLVKEMRSLGLNVELDNSKERIGGPDDDEPMAEAAE